jgi:hypothetical protein
MDSDYIDIIYNLEVDQSSYWILYDLYLENNLASIDIFQYRWSDTVLFQLSTKYNNFLSWNAGAVASSGYSHVKRSYSGRESTSLGPLARKGSTND